MSATQRGHLLWRLGDLIIANVDRLAAIEQRDNGKILSEACAQIRYMGDYFKYYGGLADKVSRALEEQSGLGQRQLDSLEKINAMLSDITRADVVQRPGERVPVFVRFSTVAGSKGSFDLARDVRGFAL